MHRFSFAAAGVAAAVLATVICACSSVPDITFTDEDTSADGGPDVRVDAPVDAARDVVSNCKATGPEICDDGIDNDCDGKTDCADSDCQPVTECVDPAPAGWTLVSYAAATRPPCATGYDTPLDLETVDGTGAGACVCACNPTTGTACSAGSFSVIADSSNCSTAPKSVPHNANCTALPANIDVPPGQAVASATAPAGPSACGSTVTPAAGPIALGRTCNVAGATKFGKGCASPTQLCAPKATGFAVCIMKLGAEACPAPYTKLKTAGTDAVDTRSCNACTCEVKGCSGSVELFQANDCTTGANKATSGAITTSCSTPTNKNFTATHYKTTLAAPANGCAIATGGFVDTMQGNIAWTDQRTVCCK